MKFRCLPLTAALVLTLAALSASAEMRAPVPAPSASTPTAVPPGPRLVSPVEMNQNASPPGALRPENPVTPQIVIPLRNPPPATPTLQPEKPALRPARPAPAGGINDAAARCEALSDDAARVACRNKLQPDTGPR